MTRFSLEGRNAVVTGGSRGIGRAIALGLAEAGANVILTYREKRDEANAVVRAIEHLGRRSVAIRMDVADRSSVEAAARGAGHAGSSVRMRFWRRCAASGASRGTRGTASPRT